MKPKMKAKMLADWDWRSTMMKQWNSDSWKENACKTKWDSSQKIQENRGQLKAS